LSDLTVHPIANIFPSMDDVAFEQFKIDIQTHGLREPQIWLFEGQILDGRHRYRVCQSLGVSYTTKEYDGDDPIGFVISLNLHRRHLDESQRAMVAARIANMRQGERTDLEPSSNLNKVSQADAAEMLNVSRHSVVNANKVQNQAEPELVEVVDRGTLPVSQAVKAVEAPPETQRQVAILAQQGQAKEAREVIQDFTVQQAWQRYPELKAQDIPQKFVPKMAATLDRMDEPTREQKRQALQTRTPGIGAELAGLPPVPTGPSIQAQVKAEINSDPATHWLDWLRDVEQGLDGLFGRGDITDLVQRWTPESRALALQRMEKSFSRWQQLMAALKPVAREGNGHHANVILA
jgi:hypothetical protein